MASEKLVELLLRVRTDEAASKKAEKTLDNVRVLMDKTAKSTLTVDEAGEKLNQEFAVMARAKAVSDLTDQTIQAAKKSGDWAAALEQVSTQLSAIGASDQEIQAVGRSIGEAQTGGGRRVSGTLGRVGREVRALPAIPLGGNLSSDAIGKVLYTADAALGALGATATTVAAASVIAAPALIGVALAMAEYNRQIEVQKRGLEAALAAQDRYLQDLLRLTTAQAQTALQEAIRNSHLLAAEANSVQATIWESWDSLVAQYGEAGARLLTAVGSPYAALEERLAGLNGQLQENDGYMIRLRAGIEGGAFAANDATEAENRLADARKRQLDAAISGEVEADRLTAPQRAERIAEIQREIEILQRFSDESVETQDRIGDLNTEAESLRHTFRSLADAMASIEARTDQTDRYFDALEREGEIRDKALKLTNELNEAAAEGIQKRRALEIERFEKEEEIYAKNDERTREILQDGAEAREKILKKYNETHADAVRTRDAAASDQAKRHAKEQLEEEDKEIVKKRDRLERAEVKEFIVLEKAYDKKDAQLEAALSKELTTKQSAIQRAQIELMNAEFSSTAIRTTAIAGREIQETRHQSNLYAITDFGASAIESRWSQMMAQLVGAMSDSSSAYALYGMSKSSGSGMTSKRMVYKAVDERINTYFRRSRLSES